MSAELDVIEELKHDTVTYRGEPGDEDLLSHYIPKDAIMQSAITGEPAIALCGKVWTPTRDPERFPVCPECQEIYESLTDDT